MKLTWIKLTLYLPWHKDKIHTIQQKALAVNGDCFPGDTVMRMWVSLFRTQDTRENRPKIRGDHTEFTNQQIFGILHLFTG